MPPPEGSPALTLVHEGWDHLKHERPLAAWACWQRALRIDPDQPAARQALDRLANASELPASARKEYRFRNPSDPERRARWDAVFQGRDLSDLATAASVFGELAEGDPTDADAPYNQALCLAWLGRNVDAIAALDRSVQISAATDFDGAVSAWMLAGVLRQGGGAEELADEFRYALEIEGDPGELLGALGRFGKLRQMPAPTEPVRKDVTVHEWLDHDWPEPSEQPLWLDEVPRVLAIVLCSTHSVRFSSTTAGGIAAVAEVLKAARFRVPEPTRTPLPLALLDASVWTIRLPEWADEATRHRIYRENVEDFFENGWIRRPRRGLDDSFPLPIGTAAEAKVEATIRLFNELAARPSAVELYQGYPFDRLRRRVGLTPRDPDAVDETDPATMTGADLDRLDPAALDDHALVDAFLASLAFVDDRRTAPFAERLIATNSPALARLDLRQVFGPLIRLAHFAGDHTECLRLVDEALAIAGDRRGGFYRDVFTARRADLLARLGQADHAEATFRDLVDRSASAASVALDGAETLLDNGHHDQAGWLATLARDIAREHGDETKAREAEALLDRLGQ